MILGWKLEQKYLCECKNIKRKSQLKYICMYTGKMSQIQKCYFSEFHVYKICFFSQLKSNQDIKLREKIEKVLENDHM